MIIKKGYNDKPTKIRIQSHNDRQAEIWIEQHGLDDEETLSYMSINELLDLKGEIDEALKEIIK